MIKTTFLLLLAAFSFHFSLAQSVVFTDSLDRFTVEFPAGEVKTSHETREKAGIITLRDEFTWGDPSAQTDLCLQVFVDSHPDQQKLDGWLKFRNNSNPKVKEMMIDGVRAVEVQMKVMPGQETRGIYMIDPQGKYLCTLMVVYKKERLYELAAENFIHSFRFSR